MITDEHCYLDYTYNVKQGNAFSLVKSVFW